MSLIKCYECEGTMSSRAAACPHCGAPTRQSDNKMCMVYGKEYDLSEALEIAKIERNGEHQFSRGTNLVFSITGIDYMEAHDLYDLIKKDLSIPTEYIPQKQRRASSATNNVPKCPTCGSTKLTKKGIGSRAIDGFFFGRLSVEGRSQFICDKCGYMW